MNKDSISSLLFVAFIIFVVVVTNQQGEWSIKAFIFNLIACGFVSLVFLLLGSIFESKDMRGVLALVYICLMAAYFQNAQQSKIRKEREREVQRIQWEKHQAWYNSLSEYEKLEYDNERLREENAILSR